MKYMGSKKRIAKHIIPIILQNRLPGQFYCEPFVGGCNVIENVSSPRIAGDSNKYLIAIFKALQYNYDVDIEINRELYNKVRNDFNLNSGTYENWVIGLVGFCASFNGRFFDGGYSGEVKTKDGSIRNYISESIRGIQKQSIKLKGIEFYCCDYKELHIPVCSIIYCDPPYRGTKQYRNSTNFNYDEFWEWCRKKANDGHKIFISEYNAPEDFKCVWEMPIKTALNQVQTKNSTEKLFTI